MLPCVHKNLKLDYIKMTVVGDSSSMVDKIPGVQTAKVWRESGFKAAVSAQSASYQGDYFTPFTAGFVASLPLAGAKVVFPSMDLLYVVPAAAPGMVGGYMVSDSAPTGLGMGAIGGVAADIVVQLGWGLTRGVVGGVVG